MSDIKEIIKLSSLQYKPGRKLLTISSFILFSTFGAISYMIWSSTSSILLSSIPAILFVAIFYFLLFLNKHYSKRKEYQFWLDVTNKLEQELKDKPLDFLQGLYRSPNLNQASRKLLDRTIAKRRLQHHLEPVRGKGYWKNLQYN